MKTVQMSMENCPVCGQLMLPTADQQGWYCPDCPPASPGGPLRRSAPPARGTSVSRPQTLGSIRPPPMMDVARHEPRSLAPADTEDFVPESLLGRMLGGRYQLEEVLGQGAMGAVYRAMQTTLKKPYAIKVLLPSLTHEPQFEARFQQEARIAAAIRHPGLVEVFDFGVEDGLAYYVMEFLQGTTLAGHLRAEGPLRPTDAAGIVADAADAVAMAHDQGVIHRDLKPANIFLAQGPSGVRQVKVLDFGVSKTASPALGPGSAPMTVAGAICGTPQYMSPEQAAGRKVDGRSDQYSLGIVLYRLLTGTVPFEAAESVVIMSMQIDRDPPPLHERQPEVDVPHALETALFRALSKAPEARFESMRAFAAALRDAVGLAEPQSRTSRTSRPAASRVSLPPVESSLPRARGPSTAPPSKPTASLAPSAPSPGRALAPLADQPRAGRAESAAPGGSKKIWIAASAAIGVLVLLAAGLLLASGSSKPAPIVIPSAPLDLGTKEPAPPTEAPKDPTIDEPALDDEPMAPSMYQAGKTKGKEPSRAAVAPTPVVVTKPVPKVSPTPAPARVGSLVVTSKSASKVALLVGGSRYELSRGSPRLLEVPAGRTRLTFTRPDGPGCAVTIDVPANDRRALLLTPEHSVTRLGVDGGPIACE